MNDERITEDYYLGVMDTILVASMNMPDPENPTRESVNKLIDALEELAVNLQKEQSLLFRDGLQLEDHFGDISLPSEP